MFKELTEWEIPETTQSTLSNAHYLSALTFEREIAAFTKRYVDHVGLLTPRDNMLREFVLRRASGQRLFLGDILPVRSRFWRRPSRRFFISTRYGIVYFDPRREFAMLVEIDGPANLTQVPQQIGGQGYQGTEWFGQFAGDGLFYDHAGRIWRAGIVSPHDWFNPGYPAILRWERGIFRSRYVSLWRLDSAKFKGLPYRYWEDRNRRIWFTMHTSNNSVSGGHSFAVLDPNSHDLQGWEIGWTGVGSLTGHRDMGGISGDDDSETVWFAWPRHRRIFKLPDIFSPFVFSHDLEVFFHPQSGQPAPAFGMPHELVQEPSGQFLFTNDEREHMGLVSPKEPPDETRSASSYSLNDPPLLYQVRYERLKVEKVYEKRVKPSISQLSEVNDMDPPFRRWLTPGTGHHPTLANGNFWFVKPMRTISLMR